MRNILILLASLAVLTGCASQATFGDAITEGEPTPLPTAVVPVKPVYTVERGDIVYKREFTGRITPVVSSNVQYQQAGRVLDVFFDTGDDVQAGDVIATLDTSLLEAQLIDAQGNLEIAESLLTLATDNVEFSRRRAQLNLDLAELRLTYAEAQASDSPTAEETFEIRSREIERDLAQLALDEISTSIDPELQADVTRARSQVEEIENAIESARLIAPIEGVLVTLRYRSGDLVEAFEVGAVINNFDTLEVTDTLREDEMSELSEGMPVLIERASVPGELLEATLITLPEPFGTGSSDTVHFRFADNVITDEFESGARVTISVVIEEHDDVLILPASAIRQFSGRNFVVIQNDNIQQRVDVKIGLEGEDTVEVLEGVEEGQMVIGP